MRICYLDTSAALKILIEEAESRALARWLNSAVAQGATLCSSLLLHTELHCAARRRKELDEQAATTLLTGIALIDLTRDHLLGAAREPTGLRSADAIHLSVALDVRADVMLTYDQQMRAAARFHGLAVEAPS